MADRLTLGEIQRAVAQLRPEALDRRGPLYVSLATWDWLRRLLPVAQGGSAGGALQGMELRLDRALPAGWAEWRPEGHPTVTFFLGPVVELLEVER